MKTIAGKIILWVTLLAGWQMGQAQYRNTTATEDPAYVQVIQKRVAKIVAPLKLKDAQQTAKVQRVIEQQYFDLNRIYSDRDERIKAIKSEQVQDKAASDKAITAEKDKAAAAATKLHPEYINRLSALLKEDQVEEVKDGMTYHTLDVTYGAYTDMLPDLTKKQKNQIMDWLVEAREHAMDAGTSEKKHAWFGKYKGRINNYLSKAGIDMKTAENAWKKRRAAGQNS